MIWPNFGNFKHSRIKKKSLLRLEMRQDPNQSQQLHFTCNDPMHHDLARNLLGNTVLHFTIVTTCTGKAVLSVVQYEGPVCIVCEGESHCHVRSMAQKDRPWSTQIYPWWSQFVDQWAFPMIPFVGRNRMVFVSYRGSSLFFSDDASVCEGRKGDSGEQTERYILDIPWYYTLCFGDPSRPLAHFHCWWFYIIMLQYMLVSLESLIGPSCYIISRCLILKALSAKHSGKCFKNPPKTNRVWIWLYNGFKHALIPCRNPWDDAI